MSQASLSRESCLCQSLRWTRRLPWDHSIPFAPEVVAPERFGQQLPELRAVSSPESREAQEALLSLRSLRAQREEVVFAAASMGRGLEASRQSSRIPPRATMGSGKRCRRAGVGRSAYRRVGFAPIKGSAGET